MKSVSLLLMSFLLFSQFVVFPFASYATRLTTYTIGEEGPPFTWGYPPICSIVVHFSWDSDTWKTGETHHVSFDFEIKGIDPNVVKLDLAISRIEIQMTGELFDRTVELAREDFDTELSQLVMRRNSTTIANTPRPYSYEVRAPTANNPSTEDTNVQLCYTVQLSGNCIFQSPSGAYLPGNGPINKTVSIGAINDGTDAPVWITYELEPQPAGFYIAIVIVGLALFSIGIILFVRSRKLKAIAGGGLHRL